MRRALGITVAIPGHCTANLTEYVGLAACEATKQIDVSLPTAHYPAQSVRRVQGRDLKEPVALSIGGWALLARAGNGFEWSGKGLWRFRQPPQEHLEQLVRVDRLGDVRVH